MPNKKRIIVGVIILIIVAGIVFFVSQKKTVVNEIGEKSALVAGNTSAREHFSENDADLDGLKDWEEGLWKTDPKNPDSDGDKTLDGDEVELKRNPLVKGPDDTLGTEALTPKLVSKEQLQPLTNTEKFSREFFSKYLLLKQTGRPINETTQEVLVNNIIESQSFDLEIRRYALSDLTISHNTNREALRVYAHTAGGVIISYSPKRDNNQDQVDILRTFMTTQDEAELKKMDPIILGYKNIIKGLLQVTVPKDIALFHLNLINGLSGVLSATEAMQVVVSDPLSSSLGLNQLKEEGGAVVEATNQLKSYFSAQGIVFNENESGYIFSPSI